jgi:hypothetical protein
MTLSDIALENSRFTEKGAYPLSEKFPGGSKIFLSLVNLHTVLLLKSLIQQSWHFPLSQLFVLCTWVCAHIS